jgi:hypothetical protein
MYNQSFDMTEVHALVDDKVKEFDREAYSDMLDDEYGENYIDPYMTREKLSDGEPSDHESTDDDNLGDGDYPSTDEEYRLLEEGTDASKEE